MKKAGVRCPAGYCERTVDVILVLDRTIPNKVQIRDRAHYTLVQQALSEWGKERLYLSLNTTVVGNCFCIVWIGAVYRGRTIPVTWRIVCQASSPVRLWTIQRVLLNAFIYNNKRELAGGRP